MNIALIAHDEKKELSILGEKQMYSEIMNAEEDLHVCFSEAGLIPFVDCMDNDFIVYDFRDKVWTMFNIVEKCKFGIAGELEQIMK